MGFCAGRRGVALSPGLGLRRRIEHEHGGNDECANNRCGTRRFGIRRRSGGARGGQEQTTGRRPVSAELFAGQSVTGRLKSVGSDTMNNLLALWSEDFRKLYPGVRIEIEGKGSGTAPPALIQGTADFGPMSRDMNPDEIAQFTSAFGYPPTQLPVAIDMLAIFVHKDNPLESLTLEQARRSVFGRP